MSATIYVHPSAIRAPEDGSSYAVPVRSLDGAAAELSRRGVTWLEAGSPLLNQDLEPVDDQSEVFFIGVDGNEVAYFSAQRRELLVHQRPVPWASRSLALLGLCVENDELIAELSGTRRYLTAPR